MILAVTEIDSGRDLFCVAGDGGLLNTSSLLLIDGDLSLNFRFSGDPSRDGGAGEIVLVNEFARSITDGDLEVPRIDPLPTEKKAVDFGAVVVVLWLAVASTEALESFSRALILCDIPEPRLTFLATGLACCWLIRFR